MGRAWLESAKIARKAGHWQTAYSAILQARECKAPLAFFQSAKLIRASGEPLRALYELDNALQASEERLRPNISQRLIDLTEDEDELDDKEWKRLQGKVSSSRLVQGDTLNVLEGQTIKDTMDARVGAIRRQYGGEATDGVDNPVVRVRYSLID